MEYLGKKLFEEAPCVSDNYRKNYVDGIHKYIVRMNEACKKERRSYMAPEKYLVNTDRYRDSYRKMLGLDKLVQPVSKPVEISFVGSDEVSKIYRLVVYVTDEIPFYSMLMIPHNVQEPVPLVITQHGGGGTPELCSDYYGKNNYNHMVQRVLARGAAALAPQLLLWTQTEIETMRAHEIPYDRYKFDTDLKRFGFSMTALEISGILKSLDYVSEMKEIDAERIAMMGLSYGGYFTLHTMAADTRIKAGYCAGVFNDRDIYDWSDWCYFQSALKFQDAEVAALCSPRKLYIQVGKEDQVFDYKSAVPEADRIGDYYKAFDKEENFIFDVWEGGHTISLDDKAYNFVFSVF